jgi:hypothetical protein
LEEVWTLVCKCCALLVVLMEKVRNLQVEGFILVVGELGMMRVMCEHTNLYLPYIEQLRCHSRSSLITSILYCSRQVHPTPIFVYW